MVSGRNKNLNRAKKSKNDEFYTLYKDVKSELKHYTNHFKDKIVYCNCDDYRESNFFKYFKNNFNKLGLKKLISTNYSDDGESSYKAVFDGVELVVSSLRGDGDYKSDECLNVLKMADIVVTNPPFSLIREYISELSKYDKNFIILGNINIITYVDIFPLIRDGKMWSGYNFNKPVEFLVPDDYELNSSGRIGADGNKYIKIGNIAWYTNLEIEKDNHYKFTKKYNTNKYLKYDNYSAIEVSRVKDIPKDYDGVMGVPVTYLGIHNSDEFEIVGSNRGVAQDTNGIYGRSSFINSKETFKRLFIRRI